jgi:hypothetical protein
MGEPFGLDGLNLLAVFNQTGAKAAIHDFTSKLSQTLCRRHRGFLRHHSTPVLKTDFLDLNGKVDSITNRALK